MKVCPKCNAEFEDNMGFCLEDGTVLEDAGSSSSEKTLIMDDLPTKVQNTKTQKAGSTKKAVNKQTNFPPPKPPVNLSTKPPANNNAAALPLALIGLVLLVAVVGGWWYYNNSKNKGNGASSNGTPSNKTPASEKNWAEVFSKASPGGSPTWTQGPPTATVTIEEFADFQCPTCAYMHPKVKEIRAAFGDRVRIVFRQFPLTNAHPHAYDAACAAEAAGVQGKFWDMQNLIFANQQTWANSQDARRIFVEYAKTLGLDVNKFMDDMIGLSVKNKVDSDLKRGRDVSVGSTPAFYINNKPLVGAVDNLRLEVEKELQRIEAEKQNPTAPAGSNSANTNSASKNTTQPANTATNSNPANK